MDLAQGGSRRLRTRRVLILLSLLVVGALVATTAHAGRTNQDDPRNASYGVIFQGNPTQDCWKHHKSEGMTDSHIIIPIFPKEIKKGEPADLGLQVQNAWKYDIAEIKVQLNLTNKNGDPSRIVALTGSAAEGIPPLHGKWQGRLGNRALPTLPSTAPQPVPPSYANVTFDVGQGAAAMFAHLDVLYPQGTGVAVQNKFDVQAFQPAHSQGLTFDGETKDRSRNLTLPRGSGVDLVAITSGQWRIALHFSNGDAPEADYALNVTVVYEPVGQGTDVYAQLRNPADTSKKPVSIVPKFGVSDVIHIPILGITDGTQHVDVKVTALLYYRHQAGGTPSEDWFERYASEDIVVGDRLVASDAAAATGGSSTVDFYMMSGEVTGFAAAFLLLPSLLLGGTYGRASRKALNAVVGGAKRRVMFHNLVSLGLTLVAVVHIVLFMLEVRYTVLMGILWGGLGAVSLLILGLTGYYQVPLIQKYGYGWWRTLHLTVGVLVVVFVAWHTIQDGPDFFTPIKQQMPQWAQNLNWAGQTNLK